MMVGAHHGVVDPRAAMMGAGGSMAGPPGSMGGGMAGGGGMHGGPMNMHPDGGPVQLDSAPGFSAD